MVRVLTPKAAIWNVMQITKIHFCELGSLVVANGEASIPLQTREAEGARGRHHTQRMKSRSPGQEEVWAAIDGSSLMFMGTQLRVQEPGMAYMLRPDGITIHSNINVSDKPVKFLYFAKFPDNDNWTHGANQPQK